MSPRRLPDAVRRFLASSIESGAQLRVLLLLHENPERLWSPSAAAAALALHPASAWGWLASLHAHRLLARRTGGVEDLFSFAPATPALAALVDEVAAAHRATPAPVVAAIDEGSDDSLRAFSDAFRLWSDR